MTFYVATYNETNHGFAQQVARIGAIMGAEAYLQVGSGVHTVSRADIECAKLSFDELTDALGEYRYVLLETHGERLAEYGHVEDAIYFVGPQKGAVLDDFFDDYVRIEGGILPTDVCMGIVLHDRLVKI